ncbi:MAG: hypothetical protein ACXQTI_03620 [Candidatus Nezhaarchaeales archaeon]
MKANKLKAVREKFIRVARTASLTELIILQAFTISLLSDLNRILIERLREELGRSQGVKKR